MLSGVRCLRLSASDPAQYHRAEIPEGGWFIRSSCRTSQCSASTPSNAFRLPFGAPDAGPPCIRHLPFAIAGDWRGFLLRVRDSQRFARCISKSKGLILGLVRTHPLHIAYNGLSAFMDVDVFDRNFLLALATMSIEGFQKRGVGPRKLVCLAKVFAPGMADLRSPMDSKRYSMQSHCPLT
jgi:hypothetical protein